MCAKGCMIQDENCLSLYFHHKLIKDSAIVIIIEFKLRELLAHDVLTCESVLGFVEIPIACNYKRSE